MIDKNKVTCLVMESSINWIKYAVEKIGLEASNRNNFMMMIIEANIYHVHLYDREVFRLYGPDTRDELLDDLLDVWPIELARSLSPDGRIHSDIVDDIIVLYNKRQSTYGQLPVTDENMTLCVAAFFSDYIMSLADENDKYALTKYNLILWAAGGSVAFVQSFLTLTMLENRM